MEIRKMVGHTECGSPPLLRNVARYKSTVQVYDFPTSWLRLEFSQVAYAKDLGGCRRKDSLS